jgi:glycosyltransferase involved in cell wall biosynthesis
MTFAMLTTFFGPHSFGGDAAFVDRLSRALARHGHDVHVIYCRDAFELSKAGQSARPYEPPPGVTIHGLSSPFGPLSPLATHQTGRPLFKLGEIRRILEDVRPEVVHFHNLSLIGGPGLLEIEVPGAIKLMTAHEHWLVCPQHVLWKHDGTLCERPDCARCCLRGGRPPQLWRKGDGMSRGLRSLDALIAPSRSTIREHARRGIAVPMRHLPYFLPHDYTGLPEVASPRLERPYVAAAGRLELVKGFQDVIDVMPRQPGLDLRIAGAGAYEGELRRLATGMENVHFEGRLDATHVAALFRGARAVVVPSLVYETFGYVVLEAFHERTPVIVRDLGALPELVAESGGGIVFHTPADLVSAMERLTLDETVRDDLGDRGFQARHSLWSESVHLARYLRLIDERRRAKGLHRQRRLAGQHESGPHAHGTALAPTLVPTPADALRFVG